MKRLGKLFALVLSLALIVAAMLVTTLPADAAGTAGFSYVDANGATQTTDNLRTAFQNVGAGKTVTMTGDTTVNFDENLDAYGTYVSVRKSFTLDLGGYTLDVIQALQSRVDIGSSATLTVTNGNIRVYRTDVVGTSHPPSSITPVRPR